MAASPVRKGLVMVRLGHATQPDENIDSQHVSELHAQLDALLAELLERHGGREIDRAVGFFLMFDEVDPALAFAAELHDALSPLHLGAQIAVHHGDVVLIENPLEEIERGAKPLEVEGVSKPYVARLLTLAHREQTLLSENARDGMTRPLDDLLAHGHWLLKGVADPVAVFGVASSPWGGCPPVDAPKAHRVVQIGDDWVPVCDLPCHMPGTRDRFVGRNKELLGLAAVLGHGHRLVTVLGTGGVGKTRLVTQFASAWLGDYPGGAWFCDLTEASTLDGMTFAVARTLGIDLGKTDAVEQLGAAIRGLGPCLLVLDNVEQLRESGRRCIDQWRKVATEATVLVTSREAIGATGEVVYPLEALDSADSVALFVARARLARRDFVLGPAVRPEVEELVLLLDHLPLAIELAAARVRMMPPAKLLSRIGQRFKLLSGGRRQDGKATLRGMLDWSWNLLDADERAALGQLSVFEGGFESAAAIAVLQLPNREAAEVLQSLVDKSLVRLSDRGRYNLMATIQAYASPKLETPEPALRRHGEYYRDRYLELAPLLEGSRGLKARQELAGDLANLVAACRRSAVRQDGSLGVGLLQAASTVLMLRGPFSLLIELGYPLLSVDGLDDVLRLSVLQILSFAELSQGSLRQSTVLYTQGIVLCRSLEDRRTEALLLIGEGRNQLQQRNTESAEMLLQRSLALYQALGDKIGEGMAYGNLGVVRDLTGRLDEAVEHYERAIELHKEQQAVRKVASGVSNLGMALVDKGQWSKAAELLDQGLAIHRQIENRRGEANVLAAMGRLRSGIGEKRQAVVLFRSALDVISRIGHRAAEAGMWGSLSVVLCQLNELDQARTSAQRGLDASRDGETRANEVELRCILAQVECRSGRFALAQRQAGLAVELATQRGRTTPQARALLCLGQVNHSACAPEAALEHLRVARELFRKQGEATGERDALAALAMAGAPEVTASELRAACCLAEESPAGERLPRMRIALAMILRQSGDVVGAARVLDLAEQAVPAWAGLLRSELNDARLVVGV